MQENIKKKFSVNDRIFQFIENQGISTYKLSKETGISNQLLSNIKNNKSKAGLEVIEKILNNYVIINPTWLLTGKENMLKKDSDDTKSEKTTFKQDDEEVIMYIAKNWERLIKHPILSKFLESEIKDSAYKLKQEFLESDLLERIEIIEAFIGEQFAEKDIENRRIQKQKLLTKKK